MNYYLRSYHGGLGDELQFSTFPRVLSELGHTVYLYNVEYQKYVLPFRNEGIEKFVWGDNPYIYMKCSKEAQWNIGDIPGIPYVNKTGDFIKNWEAAFGLEPKNSLPEIYYQPIATSAVEVVIELSGISLKYDAEKVISTVTKMLAKYTLLNRAQVDNYFQSNNIKIPHVQKILINAITPYKSLCELADIIYSSKIFISLSSGSHSLAAALRRKNPYIKQYCILPEKNYDWIMDKKLFIYPDIDYIKEGQ